jgi:protein-S-isoprenylcysteine O-methyltransferase Ste14
LSPYSKLLIVLQFTLIGALAIWGRVRPDNLFEWTLTSLCGLIAAWAFYEMRITRFRIRAEVPDGARLVTTGPYRAVRNPMYLAVLLLCGSWAIGGRNLICAALWCALVVVLAAKSRYEEVFLQAAFTDYQKYAANTWRLIPYIW